MKYSYFNVNLRSECTMAATIKDIAKAANVSVNTVSRALNDKPDVNKNTRDRILKIAKELHYVPNLLDRRSLIPPSVALEP